MAGPGVNMLATRRGERAIRLTIVAIGLLFTVLWFVPLLWVILTSLKPTGEILTNPPQWIPSEISFEHYEKVLEKPIGQWTINSLYISIVSTFLTIVLGAAAGYAFARLRFFGRNFLFWLVLASFMMPFEVMLIPLYRMMGDFGLVGNRWSIILPSVAGPFSVYLFRQFFLSIPRELEDAAAIDGAGLWARFLLVVLPLSIPACVSVGILAFAENFNQYLWPLIMSTSDSVRTLPVGLNQFSPSLQGSTNITQYYGMGAAAVTMLIIPSLIVFLILQRFFMDNVITSGMKG
ncbi:MAG: carbohydrate ABC transporter permease [Rhodobacteraceae bacterium]|nr:carbohydrate ABC transporter permease [Paracoccaceae bacterium]MCY4142049.1 carbohydrate ABC transporter permease [Paracoccaceae bacterium]